MTALVSLKGVSKAYTRGKQAVQILRVRHARKGGHPVLIP